MNRLFISTEVFQPQV